jgi:ribonuclease VapC
VIVVDSSAVVAMMLGEPESGALAVRLAQAPRGERLMSVANYVEAGTVLAGRRETPARAIEDLDAFLALAGVDLAPVDAEQARLALSARIQFGRGFGAPAGLSFGDCFAYALAKTRLAPLLFIGDDFGATDVACAMPTVED